MTLDDERLIEAIVQRYASLTRNTRKLVRPLRFFAHDLHAAHDQAGGLRLRELLNAPSLELVSEVDNITLHIYRTGELEGTMVRGWKPKFAAEKDAVVETD